MATLAPKSVYASLDDVITAVTIYCQHNGCEYIVSKRNKRQITIVCPLRSCSFVVRARNKYVGGDVHITSSDLNHTCRGSMKRKHNVKTSVLLPICSVIPSFVPTKVTIYFCLLVFFVFLFIYNFGYIRVFGVVHPSNLQSNSKKIVVFI